MFDLDGLGRGPDLPGRVFNSQGLSSERLGGAVMALHETLKRATPKELMLGRKDA